MPVSAKHTGWRRDDANSRLDMYYQGTRVGHINATGLSLVGGVTYGTGAGGVVTQASTASTAVTLDTYSGQITTVTQNIAAAGEVQFTVTNAKVAATSVPVVSIASGSTGGTTIAAVTAVAAGSFQITLTNLHASVAETGVLVINFVVLGGASA